jgi:hypothetical protein
MCPVAERGIPLAPATCRIRGFGETDDSLEKFWRLPLLPLRQGGVTRRRRRPE